MSRTFLIIGDPISSLDPSKDTSFDFIKIVLTHKTQKHQVYWCEPKDIFIAYHHGYAHCSRVLKAQDKDGFPVLEQTKVTMGVLDFHAILIRKNPPFDSNYLSLCWILSIFENKVHIINRPSTLLRYHEKTLPWIALQREYLQETDLVPTILTGPEHLQAALITLKHPWKGETLSKPWLGFGGHGIKIHKDLPAALSVHQVSQNERTLLQPVLRQIEKTGDRRLFYLFGDLRGSLVRIPKKGEIISNLASGGKAILRDLSSQEARIASQVGSFLKEIEIEWAGVDMIDCKITEINITSPTGFVSLKKIQGPDLTQELVDRLCS